MFVWTSKNPQRSLIEVWLQMHIWCGMIFCRKQVKCIPWQRCTVIQIACCYSFCVSWNWCVFPSTNNEKWLEIQFLIYIFAIHCKNAEKSVFGQVTGPYWFFSCGNAVLGRFSGISGSGAFCNHFCVHRGTLVESRDDWGIFVIQLDKRWRHWCLMASSNISANENPALHTQIENQILCQQCGHCTNFVQYLHCWSRNEKRLMIMACLCELQRTHIVHWLKSDSKCTFHAGWYFGESW